MLHAKLMEYKFKWCVLLTILASMLVLVNCDESSVKPSFVGASGTIFGRKDCPRCGKRPPNYNQGRLNGGARDPVA